MKKLFYLSCCILTTVFFLIGCGNKKPAITDSSELAGTWYGCGNALGKDSSFRADNLCLSIDSQGSFILSDIEQNADLFCGTFSIDSGSKLSITEDTLSEHRFPAGWEDFDGKDDFSYRAPDTNHLLLTYNNISYYFEKEDSSIEKKADTSVSPLLDIAETDIWYSSPESEDSTFVYELALYDKYAELYSIDPEGNVPGTFITNLLYYGNEGDDFSFYIYRDDSMDMPDIFDSLPEGISEITIRLSSSDEALTMEFDGNSFSFYNNVIYGMNTSSTAYFLNNTCFSWEFDETSHFCYFSTDEDTGSLYLFISDKKDKASNANVICLKTTIDEAGKCILFDFDRAKSRQTADKESALFQYFKTLENEHGNPLRIPFKLNDTKLKLKAKEYFGQNYTFVLENTIS